MRNLNFRFVCVLIVVGFAEGVAAGRVYGGPSMEAAQVALTVVNTFLIFVWYRNDSIERSYWPSRLLSVALAGVTILAMPYYLFKTRGFKGGLIASGLFVLTIVIYGMWVGLVQYVTFARRT